LKNFYFSLLIIVVRDCSCNSWWRNNWIKYDLWYELGTCTLRKV